MSFCPVMSTIKNARTNSYCVADVAVFPSLYEPFGIVALEAWAAKCPLIVSNVGGLGEVVENGVTGLKIPAYNLDLLVDAIEHVLGDREAAHRRAEKAFELACSQYEVGPHCADNHEFISRNYYGARSERVGLKFLFERLFRIAKTLSTTKITKVYLETQTDAIRILCGVFLFAFIVSGCAAPAQKRDPNARRGRAKAR